MQKYILTILLSLLLIFTFVPQVLAQENLPSPSSVDQATTSAKYNFGILDNVERKERVLLPKDVVINKDYFAWGEQVTISGTINGDAYIAGGNVIFDGVVNGDLLVVGGSILIQGKVTNDVRVVGGQITITGDIGGNLNPLGGNITVTDKANIKGSLVAAGGNVELFAPVGKGLNVGAGQLTLGSSIGENVAALVGEIRLASNTKVGGNLDYWSNKIAEVQQGATVSGQIKQNKPPVDEFQFEPKAVGEALAVVWLAIKTIGFIVYLIVGLLMLRIFPVYTQRVALFIAEKPWNSALVGFLALIILPIVALGLMITLIGIPFAIILMIALFIEIFMAKVYVSLLLGEKILDSIGQRNRRGWAYVAGLTVFTILTVIPIIGGVVALLGLIFGLGAMIVVKKDYYKSFRDKNLI